MTLAVLMVTYLGGLLAPEPVAADDDKLVLKFVGKNWVNGRSWSKLDYAGKLGFVCGLFDGMTLFYSSADAGKALKTSTLDSVYNSLSIPTELTVGDVVDGMDDFYRDGSNVPLPAVCAYLHFVYRHRGEKPDSVEKRVARWRRMFSR